MSTPTENVSDSDPIMERLEDQLSWYDGKSVANQRAYKRIKVVEILAAAIIPFLAALGRPHIGMVTGGLGVLITVLEGTLHLNQYQQNWINYRSTCEALKHEKYTYLGKAAPYANVPDPHALLAERTYEVRCSRFLRTAALAQLRAVLILWHISRSAEHPVHLPRSVVRIPTASSRRNRLG